MLLALAFTIFPDKWIALFLVVDFFLRAFNFSKYSPLHLLSDAEVKVFSIKNKATDIAPKRFAARIGLVFTVLILMLNLFSQTTASICFAGVLIVFAFLESVIGFCAGCWVYTYWQLIFKAQRKTA
jgi:hypothetical protein